MSSDRPPDSHTGLACSPETDEDEPWDDLAPGDERPRLTMTWRRRLAWILEALLSEEKPDGRTLALRFGGFAVLVSLLVMFHNAIPVLLPVLFALPFVVLIGILVAAVAFEPGALLAASIRAYRRQRQAGFRFLCPGCLHFGPFRHLGDRLHGPPNTAKARVQPPSRRLPRLPDGAATIKPELQRLICRSCRSPHPKRNSTRQRACICLLCGHLWQSPTLHERKVAAIGVYTEADPQALFSPHRKLYIRTDDYLCFDDGETLTYVIDLRRYPEDELRITALHLLVTLTHVWMDLPPAGLPLSRALDRIDRLTWETRRRLTVHVGAAELPPELLAQLDRRFRAVRLGHQPEDLLPPAPCTAPNGPGTRREPAPEKECSS